MPNNLQRGDKVTIQLTHLQLVNLTMNFFICISDLSLKLIRRTEKGHLNMIVRGVFKVRCLNCKSCIVYSIEFRYHFMRIHSTKY